MPSPTFDKTTRVVKRLAPTQRGALKLARRYGDALVCVRYRRDADGQRRYTTIELIVDTAPIEQRPARIDPAAANAIVSVRLPPHGNAELRARALAHGATWNSTTKRWLMTRRVAVQLGLLEAISEQKSL